MSRPDRSVAEWRAAVFKAAGLSWRTKTYLSYLAVHMKNNRQVSRKRTLVATDLGVTERTVDRMNTDAIGAGYLRVVRPGQKGVTAVYRGTFPEIQRDNSCRSEVQFSATLGGRLNCPETVALNGGSARQHGVAPLVSTEPQCNACHGWGCERCA